MFKEEVSPTFVPTGVGIDHHEEGVSPQTRRISSYIACESTRRLFLLGFDW